MLIWLGHDRNQNGYQIALDNFFDQLRTQDSRYEGFNVTAQAFSKARRKIPYSVLESLCTETCLQKEQQAGEYAQFKGYQVYAIDGSGFAVPDTAELNEHFVKHSTFSKGYYPQGLIVAAVNVHLKTFKYVAVDSLHASEKKLVEMLLTNFSERSIFVLDRGLSTQNIFRFVSSHPHLQVVARVRTDIRALAAFRHFAQSPKTQDYIKLEDGTALRLVKVRCKKYKRDICVATTLTEELATRKELAQLYNQRWEVETMFRHLKTLQRLEYFHARDFNGVMQELLAQCLYHNMTACATHGDCDKTVTNRKQALNEVGKKLVPLLCLSPERFLALAKVLLQEIHLRVEKSRIKRRDRPIYPRYSKRPVNKWSESKTRTQALRVVAVLS